MTSYSVFGAGNLGSNLIFALNSSGYSFKYIYSRAKYDVFSKHVENDLKKIIDDSDLFFISVRESQMESVVEYISTISDLTGKIFFHTANSMTSEVLKPLFDKGASVASFSPLQTFPDFMKSKNIFNDVYFLSEGDVKALEKAKEIASDLGAINLEVNKDMKIFYHMGAVISSNFLNSLLRFADKQLRRGGLHDFRILLPLIKETLHNIEKRGLDQSITGPLSRGETGTVSSHENLLSPIDRELYKLLSGYIAGKS